MYDSDFEDNLVGEIEDISTRISAMQQFLKSHYDGTNIFVSQLQIKLMQEQLKAMELYHYFACFRLDIIRRGSKHALD